MLMFRSVRQRIQLIGRLRQILRVLARHGFYRILKRLELHRHLSLLERVRYTRLHQRDDYNAALHLRQACEDLGPTFIEFGQLLSGRPDLVPETFVQELRHLLAHARPEPWSAIQGVLTEQFGAAPTPFRSIEHPPLAAASIAQIHRATLKRDKTPVVLKVQRPGIDRLIATDLAVLRQLAQLAEKYLPDSRALNPVDMVEEFAISIGQELDFILEAANTERFARAFADDAHILAPRIYWESTTPKVLVMEYIDGIPIDEIGRLRRARIDCKQVAERLLRAYLKQIFQSGFFHADPHPGNLLVLRGGRIAFIDFGLAGQISQDERRALAELFSAMLAEDYERVAALWLDISHAGADVDRLAFQRKLEPILRSQMNQPYARMRLGDLFLQMVQNGTRHGLKLPPELFLLFRTFAQVESLLRLLHPGFDVVAHCRAFSEEQAAAARAPAQLVAATREGLEQWTSTAWRLPGEVEELVKKMTADRLSIDFVHRGLEFLIGEMDRSSNRIVVGLIVAALIIGSSLIILAGTGPTLWGLPVFGLVGFTTAFILGVLLVLLVLRSGKY